MNNQDILSLGALVLIAPHIPKCIAYPMFAVIFAAKGVIWLAGGAA